MASKGNKTTKAITVCIGSEQIKVCEIIKTNKNLQVVWVQSVDTPQGAYDDGEIVDVEKISRALKQVIYNNRVYAKSIIFTVQGAKFANKEVVIPYVKKEKIKALVDANRADYFPIDTDNYTFAHSVLEQFTDEEGKKMLRLMIIAAPEEVIDSYYTLADRLELKLDTIDYVGNSSLQMIKHQVDAKPNIVIQISDNSAVVNIVKNGVLQLQRTVPYGKNVLINAVADEYDVSDERAEEMLHNKRLVHKSFDGDHITDSLRYMTGNLSRIVDYYTTRNQDHPLDKAYIITNGEEIQGLSELFATELGLNTVTLSELKNVTTHKLFNGKGSNLIDYMENLGAVFDPVNIRSQNVDIKAKKKEGKNNSVVLLIGAVFIAAVLVGFSFWNYYQAKMDRDELQRKVNAIKYVEDIVNEYYDAKDKAADMVKFVALTQNDNNAVLYMINKLEEVMPSDIYLTNLSSSDGLFTVSGVGTSKVCVAKFLEELAKLENVYDIQIAGVAEVKDEEEGISENFAVTFRFLPVVVIDSDIDSMGSAKEVQ